MPLRPGRCYSKLDTMPYTRKEYIGGFPNPKITKFDHGNIKGNFELIVELKALEDGLIRSNALESARMAVVKYLETKVGLNNFHFKVVKYPFHIIRENKMLAMAGADRLQEGMRLSFGKPIGTAAIVRKDDRIMFVRCNKSSLEAVKKSLKIASSKLSVKTRIEIKNLSS